MLDDVGAASLSLLAVFLLLSAFFSGSEAALLSVQRVRIQHLVSIKAAGAARVARMVERPDKLLPPILLGNNLVNTALAAMATALAISSVEDQGTAILLATAIVTVVLLVFGETIPKTLAARHAERTAVIVALPIQWVEWLLLPVSSLLQAISSAVARAFGVRSGGPALITEEEIKTMISVGRDVGAVEHGEAEMIRRVLESGGRRVREIMTPRPEVVWVEQGATLQDFLGMYADNYHTRFPVFHGNQSNVVGLISVKDVVRSMAQGAGRDDPVTGAMRPVHFVPETKQVQELFDEMRGSGDQIVMIADEFGDVAGLVTLKRLVESIVGPVADEETQAAEEVVELGPNHFDLDAGLSIAEANDRLGFELPMGEYETVAGLVLEHLGRVPEAGDRVTVYDLHLEVAEMRGVRIARVLVTRTPQPEPEGPASG